MTKIKSCLPLILCAILITSALCSCSDDSNYDTEYYSATTVYVTRTGQKYHRSNCRHLSKSKIEIYLDEAQSEGYEPCSVCEPPIE